MNNKFSYVLVGYGNIGRTHRIAAEMNNLAFREGTLIERRILCTTSNLKTYEGYFDQITNDYDSALKMIDKGFVDICTPNNHHYAYAVKALKAHCPVYCEKPLTVDLGEAQNLVALAEQAAIINQVGFNNRFIPGINKIKDCLMAGKLGKIIHFRIHYDHYSYLDPNRPISWRQKLNDAGGGSIIDLGIHMIDLINYLLGTIKSVRAVSRIINKARFLDQDTDLRMINNTDEFCSVQLEMTDDSVGILETSRVSAHTESEIEIEIFGTNGSIKLKSDEINRVRWFDIQNSQIIEDKKRGPFESDLNRIMPDKDFGYFMNSHIALVRNMVNMTAQAKAFIGTPSFRDAYQAQIVVNAILESAKKDQRVAIENYDKIIIANERI